jgi:hypothetical protein
MQSILFSGSSFTQGIGLELELSKRFNDSNWLKQNGVVLPHQWFNEDFDNIRKFRWPKLVCNKLGYNEIVCNDTHKDWMYNSTDLLSRLLEIESTDINYIKHIIIEPQMLRFISKEKVQYTPTEMIHLLGDPKTDPVLREQIHGFIQTFDEEQSAKNYIDLFCSVRDKHPHIHFHLLLMYAFIPVISTEFKEKIQNNIVSMNINGQTSTNIHKLLTANKLLIKDKAFCYTHNNGQWNEGGYQDLHPSVSGHQIMAENIINRIFKIDSQI